MTPDASRIAPISSSSTHKNISHLPFSSSKSPLSSTLPPSSSLNSFRPFVNSPKTNSTDSNNLQSQVRPDDLTRKLLQFELPKNAKKDFPPPPSEAQNTSSASTFSNSSFVYPTPSHQQQQAIDDTHRSHWSSHPSERSSSSLTSSGSTMEQLFDSHSHHLTSNGSTMEQLFTPHYTSNYTRQDSTWHSRKSDTRPMYSSTQRIPPPPVYPSSIPPLPSISYNSSYPNFYNSKSHSTTQKRKRDPHSDRHSVDSDLTALPRSKRHTLYTPFGEKMNTFISYDTSFIQNNQKHFVESSKTTVMSTAKKINVEQKTRSRKTKRRKTSTRSQKKQYVETGDNEIVSHKKRKTKRQRALMDKKEKQMQIKETERPRTRKRKLSSLKEPTTSDDESESTESSNSSFYSNYVKYTPSPMRQMHHDELHGIFFKFSDVAIHILSECALLYEGSFQFMKEALIRHFETTVYTRGVPPKLAEEDSDRMERCVSWSVSKCVEEMEKQRQLPLEQRVRTESWYHKSISKEEQKIRECLKSGRGADAFEIIATSNMLKISESDVRNLLESHSLLENQKGISFLNDESTSKKGESTSEKDDQSAKHDLSNGKTHSNDNSDTTFNKVFDYVSTPIEPTVRFVDMVLHEIDIHSRRIDSSSYSLPDDVIDNDLKMMGIPESKRKRRNRGRWRRSPARSKQTPNHPSFKLNRSKSPNTTPENPRESSQTSTEEAHENRELDENTRFGDEEDEN